MIPAFGRDTIRRFTSNTSDLKKLAARDYEDILQVYHSLCPPYNVAYLGLLFPKCAIPVFEGLLPEPHNTIVLDLLFTLAHWHSLAKLRTHTDVTIQRLDELTSDLGYHLRRFESDTCSAYHTYELKREMKARQRKQVHQQRTINATTQGKNNPSCGRMPKTFNLQTYKVHALGDYVEAIKTFGTTDSYSTEVVSIISVN
jgi:hypothetical protein